MKEATLHLVAGGGGGWGSNLAWQVDAFRVNIEALGVVEQSIPCYSCRGCIIDDINPP